MRNRLTIVLISLICFCKCLQGQEAVRLIRSANDLYKKQQYAEAEKNYNKAIKKDSLNIAARYNLGNTLYRLNKKGEAIKAFEELANNEKEPISLSKQYYNKGVILSSERKLEESIDAYKNALRQNPDDKEVRENLQKALLELKKQNEKKDTDNKKKKNQQKQPPSPKMNQKEAEQKLKQLEQKEKEVQQRLQKEKSKGGGSLPKDW